MNILLIEDDSALAAALRELLEREGYTPIWADSVSAAEVRISPAPDLVLMDITLPDGDGVSLCRSWRSRGIDVPILFLTAKDEEFDIVRGLDAGGNDYVTKPFRLQELLSRIRALLRTRTRQDSPVVRGSIRLDSAKMQVFQDGASLNLTVTEYKILQKLITSPGIVTRGVLLESLWDADARFVDDNTLSVHVSRLREKLGGKQIRTIRGVGYQWID